MRKYIFLALAATAGVALAAPQSWADTINFSQFGADETILNSPLSGLTTDGVGVTLTSPNGSFEVLTEGTSWTGEFAAGSPILFDGDGSGAITLDFASGITSLTLAGQSNASGAFTETAYAYSGATLVDQVSASGYNYVDPAYEGTIPFLTLTGTDITSVVWGATNDSLGLALYGGSGAPNTVPEPGTLALFAAALLGLSGVSLLRKKKTAA